MRFCMDSENTLMPRLFQLARNKLVWVKYAVQVRNTFNDQSLVMSGFELDRYKWAVLWIEDALVN